LLLVGLDGSLVLFAWAVAVEQVVASTLFLLAYRVKVGRLGLWRFQLGRARDYLRTSWPLILSGVATTLNRRVDIVLLGVILSTSAVGTYAVAARLSEIWYFVPTAVASAVFPTVIRAKDTSEALYRRRLQQLYGAFVWAAVGVAVVVTLVAEPLISLLYEEGFSEAAAVLVIHVWTAPFLFMGVLFSKWLIIEGLLMTSLVLHSLGAGLNIGLNLLLIPAYGPTGAAIASLISYATATYLGCFLSRRTWPAAVDMTLGVLLPFRFVLSAFGRRWRAASSPTER
jgi:O-antigen/teichoic acid export membrane protein